jgi:hypothetical protein
MSELLQNSTFQLILWLGFLALLTAAAVVLIRWARREAVQGEQQEQPVNDLLAKCREMHSQGVLTEAEFRTIKTKLAARLQDELKDNGETG